jgi:hypothetical protein
MELSPARRYIAAIATITVDTLKLARKLEAAGFSQRQAADTAEALADSLGEVSDLATKSNLAELKAERSPSRLRSCCPEVWRSCRKPWRRFACFCVRFS